MAHTLVDPQMAPDPPDDSTKHQFIAFRGDTYYPVPGWRAYVGSALTLEVATTLARGLHEIEDGWWQVVDLNKRQVVAGEGRGHCGLSGYVRAGVRRGDVYS